MLITVVASKVATPELTKLVPHAIVRAVPLSLKRMVSSSPLFGVPVRLVVMLVILTARAVMSNSSVVSVFIAGVAELAVELVRNVLRLFVKVSVVARPTSVSTVVGSVTVLPLTVTAPELSTGDEVKVCTLVKVCVAFNVATVPDVDGNVIVAPFDPAIVSELFTFSIVPLERAVPMYEKSQEAVPVPDVRIQVSNAEVLGDIMTIVFAPDDCTVTAFVLLFLNQNCCPSTSVEATGSRTICVVDPVNA